MLSPLITTLPSFLTTPRKAPRNARIFTSHHCLVPRFNMNTSNPNTPLKSTYRRKVAWYKALKDPDPAKLTPHANEIVRAIQSFGRPATRAEVEAALAQRIPSSKQKPTRVLSFWRKILLAAGFIRITKKLAPARLPETGPAGLKKSPAEHLSYETNVATCCDGEEKCLDRRTKAAETVSGQLTDCGSAIRSA